MKITNGQLQTCLPYSTESNRQKYLPFINIGIDKYIPSDLNVIAMFIAQIGYESGSLKYNTEIASGSAYEGRKDLGNIFAGDGVRYKGRGLIQITGRINYQKLSDNFGVNFIDNPYLVASPEWAVFASMWWWENAGLNATARFSTEVQFKAVTRKINGGLNGYNDRYSLWMNCLKTFNIKLS